MTALPPSGIRQLTFCAGGRHDCVAMVMLSTNRLDCHTCKCQICVLHLTDAEWLEAENMPRHGVCGNAQLPARYTVDLVILFIST